MSKCYPETIPAEFTREDLADAYQRGWNHGHGIACHNVPTLGETLWTECLGRVTVDAENIREVHSSNCFEAESNSRSYSPFEFTAHEFNSSEEDDEGHWDPAKEGLSEELWEAFEQGASDAISADLAEYTDDDYGIVGQFDTVTGTAPSYWACYFINGDAGDMSDEEIAQADAFAAWLGGHIVSCDDAGFCHWHDARQFGTLASDCQTYTALIERD